MKKSILYFLTAIVLFAVSCSESYDDSALVGRVDNLENRVAKLEELCKQMNTNISSLQTLVNALQNNDYVTGVTPITKDGKTVGYTITFTKSQPITIYHGEDGKDGQNGADGKDGVNGTDGQDGHTPIIGVKQDTDGIYYWTLDGDWLLDDNGNKIKAQGTDGKDGADGQDGVDGKDGADGKDGVDGTNGKDGEDGADGKDGQDGEDGQDGVNGTDGKNGADGKDGITPQLKIENDYWYISYDNGSTWTQLGKAKGDDGQDGINGTNGTNGIDGEDGDSFFQNVDTTNNDYVIFTLADGTELAIPRFKNLSISFDIADGAACMPSASIKVGYTLSGADSGTTIETIGDGGWKSVVTKTSISNGYITVTAPENGGDGKVVMLATTSTGYTAMKAICFEEGIVADINDAYQAGYEESTLKITLKTNLAYTVSIPDDAKSWISVADTRATMRTETLIFTILENPEENPARSATIKLIGECGDLLQSFVIMQDLQPSSNPIVFADANVKKVCVEKFDTNGDGELSEKEAAKVTNIERNFFGDYASVVTSFDELKYFTNLSEIREKAFFECINIVAITLPNSLTSLWGHAFANCGNLSKINIPNSLVSIEYNAFGGCGKIKDVYITDLDKWVCVDFIGSYSNPLYLGANLWVNDKKVTSYTFPNGTTKIKNQFQGCISLTSVIIPEGVIAIGDNAFRGCINLSEVEIPESVITIGEFAFEYCSNISSINIPNNIVSIGHCAFFGCSKIKNIYIPESVTSLGSGAFYECENLEFVYCKNATPPTRGDSSNLDLFGSGHSIAKIYVPTASVDAYKSAELWQRYADKIVGYDFIPNNQIYYTTSDGNIITPKYTDVFGANITSNVYENGKGVITFDGDVTKIDAFNDCATLTGFTMPESVTEIGPYAFDGCENLNNLNISNNVKTIGEGAFMDCTSITEIYIPNSVATIKYDAFNGCTNLQSIQFPNSVTTMGAGILWDCENLESVSLSENITSIGNTFFQNCRNLPEVTIPSKVSSIAYYAFKDCRSLSTVYCKNSTPPSLGNDVFLYCNTISKIYVPTASVNVYKAANGWKDFADKIEGYDF